VAVVAVAARAVAAVVGRVVVATRAAATVAAHVGVVAVAAVATAARAEHLDPHGHWTFHQPGGFAS
jgi:hypothetical protein